MSFRRSMFRIYWGMRGVIAPTLRYSQYLYADVLTRYVHPGVDWLDLGCGHQVLPDWRAEEEKAPGSELQVDRRAGQVGFGFRRPSILDLSPRVMSRCDRMTANWLSSSMVRSSTRCGCSMWPNSNYGTVSIAADRS